MANSKKLHYRTFRLEELEDRRLLSVWGGELATASVTDSVVMASSLPQPTSAVPVILATNGAPAQPWNGTTDTTWFDTATYDAATEYTLDTAEKLAGLASIVNGTAGLENAYDFAGKTVKLGADIDLAGRNWTPIGLQQTWTAYKEFSKGPHFAGTFDGNTHTISNLSITSIPAKYFEINTSAAHESGWVAIGLFGTVVGTEADPAFITDVTLVDAKIDLDVTATSVGINIGLVAGQGAEFVSFTDCHVTKSDTGTTSLKFNSQQEGAELRDIALGSVTGMLNRSSMNDCSSVASITATSANGGHKFLVGGLFGLWNCWAPGPDDLYTPNLIVANSTYNGVISVSGVGSANVGGIGNSLVLDGKIENCSSSGSITSVSTSTNAKAGGIMGALDAGSYPYHSFGTLMNCRSDMALSVETTVATPRYRTSDGTEIYVPEFAIAGGIIANITSNAGDTTDTNLVRDNEFTGTILVNGNDAYVNYAVGGIIGMINNSTYATGVAGDIMVENNTLGESVTVTVNGEETTQLVAVGGIIGGAQMTDVNRIVIVQDEDKVPDSTAFSVNVTTTTTPVMIDDFIGTENAIERVLPLTEDSWDGSIDISWFDPATYAATTEYTLSTAEQLAGLAAIVNGTAGFDKAYDFSGKTVTLTADIDLAGRNWTPIGLQKTWNAYKWFFGNPKDPTDIRPVFAGTFDGGNHTISNLSITSIPTDLYGGSDYISLGLFGTVAGKPDVGEFVDTTVNVPAALKNITLVDANIDIAVGDIVGDDNPMNIGFLTGQAGRNVTIENCHVTKSDPDSSVLKFYSARTNPNFLWNVGSIVGIMNTSSMIDCSAQSDIHGTMTDTGLLTGGLFGLWSSYIAGQDSEYRPELKVENCEYDGEIVLNSDNYIKVGGIGNSTITSGTITNCESKGNIEVLSDGLIQAGGIFGIFEGGCMWDFSAGSITDCVSSMTLNLTAGSGEVKAGGIVGVTSAWVGTENKLNLIQENTFSGSIEVEGTSSDIAYYVGGIAGVVNALGITIAIPGKVDPNSGDFLVFDNTVDSDVDIIVNGLNNTTSKDLAVGSLVGGTFSDTTHTVTVKNFDVPNIDVIVGITSASTLYPTNLPVATVSKEGTTFEVVGLVVNTLVDESEFNDTVSLREAIAYAEANIEWTAKEAASFEDGQFGYSFKTNAIVAAADMDEGEAYYTPTGWDGSEASIKNAMVTFDASLLPATGLPTITLTTELAITKAIVIDGLVGTGTDAKQIVLDRGLVTYNEENFDLAALCQTDPDTSEVWVVEEGAAYSRILNISTTNVSVSLSNMKMQGAYHFGYGGVIYNRANLTLDNIDIVGNYSVKYTSDSVSSTIYNTGSLRMFGGSIQGNRLTGWGNIVSKNTDSADKTIQLDGVTVRHNFGGNGVFIEPWNEQNIIVVNCTVDENIGAIIHTENPFNLEMRDSTFTNNFANGKIYLYTGTSTIENCVFDNSGYDIAKDGNYWASFAPYVGGVGATDKITFTNCLFNEYSFAIGKYSGTGLVDITLDRCTLTNCFDVAVSNNTGMYTVDGYKNGVSLTLKDSLILGNGTDLSNGKTEGDVNITIDNSIVGRYDDTTGTAVLTKTSSIVDTTQGTIEFVQTDDPTADGYYEVKSVTMYGETIGLLGTSAEASSKQVSIIGYHSAAATDLNMTDITNALYTTVTTLDDTENPSDGVISLREAIAYAEANIEWTAKGKADFTDGQFGYSFKTNAIVAAADMVDGEAYYTPTGWDGSEASIKNAMITFDSSLTGNTITLEAVLTTTTAIAIDGTLGNGQSVTITSPDGYRLVNSGTLALSNVALDAGLIQNGTATFDGNVTLGYLAGAEEGTEGMVSVLPDAVLMIRDFDETYSVKPESYSDYRVHNKTEGDLTIGAKDGQITTPTALLTVTGVIAQPIYTEDTAAGQTVVNINYFGMEDALPVGLGQASFTVTRGADDVSGLFGFIASENEARGIAIGSDDIAAGDYTLTVNYGNLTGTFSFTVTGTAALTLTPDSGTATPQNKTQKNISVASGTFTNFINHEITLEWNGEETGEVTDYFAIQEPSAGTFELVYTGGLATRADAYNVTVTVSGDLGRTASADFALTVKTPTLALDPTAGSVTFVTEEAVLSTVETTNFTNPVVYTFMLDGGEDETHFSVVNNELIYTGDETLPVGQYELAVTASDGIDTSTVEYAFTILENRLDIVSIFSSITVSNHNLDLARLLPVNFPEGTIEYTLSWGETDPVGNYFTVKTVGDKSYIHYSAGLGEGTYNISVQAVGTPTNPDDGVVDVTNTYTLTVTKDEVSAEVILDPTNRQMEVTEAVNDFELAGVSLTGFKEAPTFTVSAWNTTAKDTQGNLTKMNFNDCFTVVDGKLRVVQDTTTQTIISGEYAVVVTATTKAGNVILQEASANFTLTLYDKVVTPEATHITIDFDPDSGEFVILDTDNPEEQPIDKGEANVLVVQVDAETTPVITITQDAMDNLDAIHVESTQENVIVVEPQDPTAPSQPVATHYVISSAPDGYDSPTALTLTAVGDGDEQIARITSSGTKSLSFDSGDVATQYDINTLPTDILITPNGDDKINFSGGTSDQGIILDLDNQDYFQTLQSGQSASLKIDGNVGEVILSPGNDVITGSSSGSVITDTSDSWNTITLQGNSDAVNKVTLNGGSTIIVNGEAQNNIKVTDNGDKTVINLEKATGESKIEATGDQITVTGGLMVKELTLTGDSGIVNMPKSTEDITIRINGNGAIVKTGSGKDKVYINGNDSLVSLGDGNDIVYIEGTSAENSISTGKGDDIVIASTTAGGNTIYSDNGNDFIIGGGGADRIFGGTGNSLLAGGGGADLVVGGTARDILLANISLNMMNKSTEELLALRNQLFNDTDPEQSWWNMDLNGIVAILGSESVADGHLDNMRRKSDSGVDIFFRNLTDGDRLSNVLDTDLVID
ncbi:MAG: hypothetical protein Q4G68_10935 [Planctomycetia bacterium]|nr:hypothetical protein [Planctomycetia bacterium]